jgi:hypothetical protein
MDLDGDTEVWVPTINAEDTVLTSPPSPSITSNKNNSGGGGGSTKKASEARGKKTDIVERYKELDDKLDDVSEKIDDASKASDRLWGANRVKAIQRVNKGLKEEISLLEQKREAVQKNLATDRTEL